MSFPDGFGTWFQNEDIEKMRAEIARLKAENEVLWQMVDEVNEAVRRAAEKLS